MRSPEFWQSSVPAAANFQELVDPSEIVQHLKTNPLVKQVEFLEQICTAVGWEQLVELVETNKPNRLLIGACLPYVYQRKLQELSRQVGMDPALMEVVDVNAEWAMGPATSPSAVSSGSNGSGESNGELKAKALVLRNVLSALETGIAKLKWVDPQPDSHHCGHSKSVGYRWRYCRHDGGPGHCRSRLSGGSCGTGRTVGRKS